MADVGEIRRDRGTGSEPRWLEGTRRWQARYVAADGKRKAVYSRVPGPAGKREAAKLRDDMIRATDAGVNPSLMPLAEYLERTVYAVRDGKTFIYKFNCRNQVYHAIEPWIDEIVKGFFEPAES